MKTIEPMPLCILNVSVEPIEGKMPQLQHERALKALEIGATDTIEALVTGILLKAGCEGWKVNAEFER